MKFTTERESLLRPLQLVTGGVERRQTLPVLSNVLIKAADGAVSITGTDLEVQLVATIDGIDIEQEGAATVPARKLADIWRALGEGAPVSLVVEGDRTIVRSGRSRFALATLPVDEFPDAVTQQADVKVSLPLADMQRLLDKTSFAMAQQDVRYFLNGLLLEITDSHLRAVATDGHRMAMCTVGLVQPMSNPRPWCRSANRIQRCGATGGPRPRARMRPCSRRSVWGCSGSRVWWLGR